MVNDRLVRQRGFFFGMVLILAVLALILVWQFIQSILMALALVVILKPVHNWFLEKKLTKGKQRAAAGLTLAVFVLVIAVPAVLIIGGAITQATGLFNGLALEGPNFSLRGMNTWLESMIQALVARKFQVEYIHLVEGIGQLVAQINAWLRVLMVNLGRSIPAFFTNVFIMLVIIYVLLPRYRGIGKNEIMEIVPYPPEITQLFLDKIDLMIKAMFKGTFVIAIVQGLAMGLILWVAGVPYTMFLTLISIFLSMVPVVGISLLAWPLGIVLIVSGDVW